jgi:hypothetical protein
MVGLSSQKHTMTTLFSRRVAQTAVLIAVGAVVRASFSQLAMLSGPTPIYGILIKIGLTETLTFILGYAIGATAGLLGGASIIIISDLVVIPGAWTPFIAGIIGLVFGVGGGAVHRIVKGGPTIKVLASSVALLTLLSEFLQNAWVTLFFGVPLYVTLAQGIPTLATALINNVVLLSTIGPRIISYIMDPASEHQVVRATLHARSEPAA